MQKRGGGLAGKALNDPECTSVVFMIWNSGWGRSNLPRLEKAFVDAGREAPDVFMFDTGLGDAGARAIAGEVAGKEPDCAIFVANLGEEARLLNALHASGTKLRVYSHWGILLGDFTGMVPHEVREYLDFQFIQTCALQQEKRGSRVLQTLFKSPPVAELSEVEKLSDIPSAVGFVNAYDLAQVLIAAAETLPGDADILRQRENLKNALETLKDPVDGILKQYSAPFARYSADNPDAHEALGQDDLCMARFASDDRPFISSTTN